MSDQKVTFSVFLKDYLSQGMDKISKHGNAAFTKLHAGFGNIKKESKKAELSIDQINKKLDDLKKVRKIKIDIGEIKKINREIDHLTKQKRKLEATNKTGAGMGVISKAGIVAAAAAVAYKAGQFIGDSFVKYNEGAQVDAQLRAGIISTKGVSGKTLSGMSSQASALQNTTLFDDEATKGAQAVLLTFTKVRNEVFDRAIPAIQDMATRMKMDMPGAALMVGKALNEPVVGMLALRRAGVQLSEEQQAQVKHFVKIGELSKAQAILLKELETEFGGSAEAAANAGTGGFTILKNKFNDLKEGAGGKLAPALVMLTKPLGRLVDNIKEGMEIPISEKLERERMHVNSLTHTLMDANLPMEARKKLYGELNQIAPEVVRNLDIENISISTLKNNLSQYNAEIMNKIRLERQAEQIKPYEKLISEQFDKQIQAVEWANDYLQGYDEKSKKSREQYRKILYANMESGAGFEVGIQRILTAAGGSYDGNPLTRSLNQYRAAQKILSGAQSIIEDKNKRFLQSGGFNKLGTPTDPNDPTAEGLGSPTAEGLGSPTSSVGSGGASVKQITINLDSIIRENTNVFEPGQDPKDATDFLKKLTDALQIIVNDVNYS